MSQVSSRAVSMYISIEILQIFFFFFEKTVMS